MLPSFQTYGIQFNRQLRILYADEQLIISGTVDNLQRASKKLFDVAKDYDLKINVFKTKSMGFQGKNIQRVKIVIDNKIIEQVSSFNYLGNIISNLNMDDIEQKIHKYNFVIGTTRRNFGRQMLNETQIRYTA